MSRPSVRSTLRDPISNVTFIVNAPRALSRAELLELAREFYSQPKIRRRERPFRNTTVHLTARLDGAPLEEMALSESA
jgi:hypothetical protein